MDIDIILVVIEYIGTIAFAISGALIAIENKMDILGVTILGCTTAVGGGLFRDILIGDHLPSLFSTPSYVIVAAITTLLVFMIMSKLKDSRVLETKTYKRTFNIVDSLGLGVFIVIGATKTMEEGITNEFFIIFCSVLTAVGGGMFRDIMANKIPAIFRKHIYCVAAIIGAMFFYHVTLNSELYYMAATLTIILVVTIRYLAYYFELNLPKVKFNKD